jgi:hypothetical protein
MRAAIRHSTPARVARFFLLDLLMVTTAAGADDKALNHETVKAMPMAAQIRDCLACHTSDKDKPKLLEPTRSCDANCLRCHKDMEKHHPVGPEVEEKDKVSLPLLGSNKVACISCHDLKTTQTDTRSWKAQSLFGRLFQSQSKYKTYYLRINNSKGQLCKACH